MSDELKHFGFGRAETPEQLDVKELTQREKFLTGLETLRRRHGFEIAGCGCCGSPRVQPTRDRDAAGEYVTNVDGACLLWLPKP